MNGQYFILICDNKEEAIEQAMDALREYSDSNGAMNMSRGTGANYRQMSKREKEIYEMGLRESMTPEEKRIYEMGKRDAYGRNGAENRRNREDF